MALLPLSTENINVLSLHFSCPILADFGPSQQIFVNVPLIKFHENPPSGSRADTCGQTEGQADMTMRTATFQWFHERA
jgi:hypothetical protein